MKILVVDDAPDMRLVIKHLLINLGHDVDTAVDGADAWLKIKETEYQVVISDWVMPNLNGLDLCSLVRDESFDHYIYFILLTGMSGKKNLISGIEAGADDFVNKPVDANELKVRLRSAERVLDLEYTLAQKNLALEESNERIQKDLVNAEETQLSLLPEPLNLEHLKSSWLYKPAIYVGGDTFNYFSPSPDFLVFFSIDISGHGVSSAMLSMSLQASLALKRGFYGGPIKRDGLGAIPKIFADNVNKMLLDNASHHYLTMIFGIMDFKEKDIHFVQSGHPHPLWYEKKNNTMKPIEIDGFPIGLYDGAEFETQHLKYNSGDKFILYSDGISENESALNGEMLESDNLYQHFEEIKDHTGDEMIQQISDTWLTPKQMRELPDDLSILVFEFQ